MPILQSRVIALLDALEDYRNALGEAIEIAQTNYTLYHQGSQTAEQAISHAALQITQDLVKNKANNDTTFQVESFRFGPARRKHNERAALAAQVKRATKEHQTRLQAKSELFTDLPEISPEISPPISNSSSDESYEEAYQTETHCPICRQRKSVEYCSLPSRDVAEYCPLQKPADPGASR